MLHFLYVASIPRKSKTFVNIKAFKNCVSLCQCYTLPAGRPNDADNESGIDVDSTSSGSNAASVASSTEYTLVGGSVAVGSGCGNIQESCRSVPTVSTAARSIDNVDEFIAQIVVLPPPENFDASDNGELCVAPHVAGFELPPPIECYTSGLLPTLVELPEEEMVVPPPPVWPSDENDEPWTPAPDYDADNGEAFRLPPPMEFISEGPTTTASLPTVGDHLTMSSCAIGISFAASRCPEADANEATCR
jgi:hypothetical protein